MKNIIVFGMARSGTSYVNQLIARYLWLKYGDGGYHLFDEFLTPIFVDIKMASLMKYIFRLRPKKPFNE